MKAAIILLAVATTASLSASAGLSSLERTPEYAKLDNVHAGMTQDEVRAITGRPDVITGKDGSGSVWIWETRDEYGELDEYDIDFDPSGKVRGVISYRDH